MDAATWGCSDELFASLSASVDLLSDLPVQVSRLGSGDLDAAMTLLHGLAAVAAAGRFTVASEAGERSDVRCSASGTVCQWVTDRCPTLEARDAGILAKVVTQLNTPSLEPARAAVATGRLSVPAGVVAADAAQTPSGAGGGGLCPGGPGRDWGHPRLRGGPVAAPGGAREVRARHGDPGRAGPSGRTDVPVERARHRRGDHRVPDAADPESRAVVESAINALAAPRPVAGTDDAAAARDTRTVEQRRGDALVDVCRRMVALGSAEAAVAPLGVKATVLVTLGYDELVARTRPGTLLGGTTSGTVLGPETVRKIACDPALLPVLLGSSGQVLDLGHTTRAFTPAQVKALWLRDRHCTYPGCDIPATWCDAHHVRHWVDGGPTDLGNGALLCDRHHHVVHRDRITAAVTSTGVEWDRIPGSYDRARPRDYPPDP